MKNWLLSTQQPDGPPPATLDLQAVMRDVGALIGEMTAAGALVFTGGLTPAHTGAVVRGSAVTDGAYTPGPEHVGGITIVRAADRDEAIAWGTKLAAVIGLPVEVRGFQG